MMKRERYNKVNNALKKRFGCKVYKVTLESGCGCLGKCIFCSQGAYDPLKKTLNKKIDRDSIQEMLLGGINYVRRRHQNTAKFISYFQDGSNSTGPVEKLREIFYAAIDHPDVVGLAVSTRPDTVSDELLHLFEELSKKTMLTIELGLQSANERTLELINRGHTTKEFEETSRKLIERKIDVCAHIILGLPEERAEDMKNTALFLSKLKISGVKIHNLHVIKGTKLEDLYSAGKVTIPNIETYAGWAVDFIELLDPSIIIHRVNGHAPRKVTIAPKWSVNKLAVMNAVERELERRDTWQGKKLTAARLS